MDLCLCFGEPSPDALLGRLTAEEFKAWRMYAGMKSLPCHTDFHITQFMAAYLTGKGGKDGKKFRPEDFWHYVTRPPKQNKSRAIGNALSAIFQTIRKVKSRGTG